MFTVTDPEAILSASDVTERLSNGVSVQILTDSGNISIDAPITWISNASLDLEASGNIAINADVTAAGDTAKVIITPQMASPVPTYSLGNGARITLSGGHPTLIVGGATYVVINSVEALQNILDDITGNYALGSDIDASPTWQWNPGDGFSGFVPLGNSNAPFIGTFDGLGHVISNLYMEWIGTSYVGLFGSLATTGTVRNVGLPGEHVRGYFYVGGLVGLNEGNISGTYTTGTVTGAAVSDVNMAGGLVGYNSQTGYITQSYSTAAVSGGWGTGGFAGQTDGIISDSYSMGNVIGYNLGRSIGGFTGWYNFGSITNSYSTGYVTGASATVGGFLGGFGDGGGTATDNYYDQSKSGAGGGGATGLSTAQMMQQASFPNWDFANTWSIAESFSYPYLRHFKQVAPFSSQCATQPAGLIGWWPAEGTGDETISNGSVFLSSSGAFYSTGEVGQAFNFDGRSGYAANVEPSSRVMIGNQSWTVAAWIQASYLESSPQEIVSRYYCGADSSCISPTGDALYELVLTNTGQAEFNVRDNASVEATAEGINDLRDSRWHLVVGTLDRGAGQIRIYVDGVLQDVGDASSVGTIDDRTSPFEIGRLFRQEWASPTAYFKGLIDEVQIYNRALSASEVQSIFDAGSAGMCSAPPELSVDTSSLTFTVFRDESNVTPEVVSVDNYGAGYFAWTASATQPWLSLSPTSGSTPGTLNVVPNIARLEPGTYTDTITISADGIIGSPAEVTVTLNVLPLATTVTTLSSSSSSSAYGSSLTLTATVTGGSLVPTGSVIFIDGIRPLALSVPLDTSGIATLSMPPLSIGTHSIIAVYSGDSSHFSSTASVLSQIITPGSCYAVPAGLVNWWSADGNAGDRTGTANGTLVNAPVFGQGLIGQAFSFNGDGQYVSLPNSPVQANPSWTVSAWFNTAYAGGIFGMQSGAYGSQLVSQGGNWQPLMYVGTDGKLHGGAWPAKFDSPQPVSDESWHHAVVTYDGNIVIEYLDGVPFGAIPGITMGQFTTTFIGTAYTVYWDNSFDGWFDFNGLIDEVTIFNRALSFPEIQSLYSGTTAGFCQVPTPSISSISPNSVVAGTGYLDLVVHGANFTSGSVVLWNGSARSTTFVDASTLQADIAAGDLASVGTASISVQNPSPGGGLSSTLTLTITPKSGGASDMSLAAGLAPAPVGSYPMYHAIVTNNGPDTATNAVVTDVLDRFQFVSATYTTGSTQGQCAFDADSSTVTCYIGSMPSGATGTIKVVVTAPSSGWASQEFLSIADQADPNPRNNASRVVSGSDSYNTPVGANELVQTSDGVMIAFSTVTKPGNTTLSTSALTIAPPSGYRAGNPSVLYNVNSTATFAGGLVVTLPFSSGGFHKPGRVRLFHLENGGWVDRTSALDVNAGRISAAASSLSTFAVFEPINHSPTAAAGPDQTISAISATGTTVHLDASTSSDPDMDTLTYRWTGPFKEGDGAVSGAAPAITLPIGVSKLSLVVNDGESDSAVSNLSVTVTDFTITTANSSPTVKTGQPAAVDIVLSPVYGTFATPIVLTCPSLPSGLSCSFSPATVTPGTGAATTRLTISRTTTASVSAHRTWLLSYVFVALFGCFFVPVRMKRARLWIGLIVLTAAVAILVACGGGTLTTPALSPHSSTSNSVTIIVTGSAQSLQHSTTVVVGMD